MTNSHDPTRERVRIPGRSAAWVGLGFAAVALPFAVLLNARIIPAGSGFLWDFSKGLGFAALALAGLQFVLTGRFRRLTLPFGIDIVFLFHRYLALGVLALALAHFGIFYIWFEEALGELNPLTARWELTSGRVALVCFAVLILSSEFRRRIRLDYAPWRYLHVTLAVIGFVAAVAHVLGVGHFTAALENRLLWLAVTAGWLGLIAWVRIVKPWRQARNPFVVSSIEVQHGEAVTLTLVPQGRPLPAAKPGQFAWLTLGRSPFRLSEHPFTIMSRPSEAPAVSMTIKGLGDFSRTALRTQPGTRAYLDGPFGIFSIDNEPAAKGFVMIAGGIGITPMIANLRAMREREDRRPVILIYANPEWDEAAFREELAEIESETNLRVVHVLEKPPEGFSGEAGLVDRDMLARQLGPETRTWPHMLCGPPPMTAAARKALLDLGVPLARIESELFDMV